MGHSCVTTLHSRVNSLHRRDHDDWDATSYIAGNVSALSSLVIQTVNLRKSLLKNTSVTKIFNCFNVSILSVLCFSIMYQRGLSCVRYLFSLPTPASPEVSGILVKGGKY